MRIFIIVLSLLFVSLNVYAAKGGRWGSTDPDSYPKGKNKTKNVDTVSPTFQTYNQPAVEADSGKGSLVYFELIAIDDKDGEIVAQCTPTSGQLFSVGTTDVICAAADSANNSSNYHFQVQVIDSEAPVLSMPADLVVNSIDGSAISIDYSVMATDRVDEQVDVSCAPSTKSYFQVGETRVTCEAADDFQNKTFANFLVTVVDATPEPENQAPLVDIIMPANNTVLTTGASLTVSASVSDSDGFIQSCLLYQNNELVRGLDTAPYDWGSSPDDFQLQGLAEGNYYYVVECIDDDGYLARADLNITVEAATPSVSDVFLEWRVPTQREDGSALLFSDIHSYEIYYYTEKTIGSGESVTIFPVDTQDDVVSSYFVRDLPHGQYFFSIATVDSGGNVSPFTPPVSITINTQ